MYVVGYLLSSSVLVYICLHFDSVQSADETLNLWGVGWKNYQDFSLSFYMVYQL